MTRSKNQYIFRFDKLLKNWRNGQCYLVTYDVFPQDSTLCVVTGLDKRIKISSSLRENQNISQLLISTFSPHKRLVSSLVSGWVKKVLSKVGINTDISKAHSTRSASTSSDKTF